MSRRSSTPVNLPQIKAAGLRTFREQLRGWYQAHGRHNLPWRQTTDPYAIWISEVMLQQTQVSTVLERFYHPFLKSFPTLQHLAAAPREKVLKAWEGLGYYRRAGFLHEAAKRAHNGLPDDVTALTDLPGIGRNTAHAILAFAHHKPVAILEANVKRIVARIFALATPSDQQLWAGAETLLDAKHPFDYNQSMMDLGSLVCTPKVPDCPACPANTICLGQSNPEAYPAPKPKKKSPTRQVDILVTEDASGRLYLEQRSDALLGGLYGFPQDTGGKGTVLGHITHIYTHFRLEGRVLHQKISKPQLGAGWHSREEIRALPLSKLDHKVLALVDTGHSAAKKSPKINRRSGTH